MDSTHPEPSSPWRCSPAAACARHCQTAHENSRRSYLLLAGLCPKPPLTPGTHDPYLAIVRSQTPLSDVTNPVVAIGIFEENLYMVENRLQGQPPKCIRSSTRLNLVCNYFSRYVAMHKLHIHFAF